MILLHGENDSEIQLHQQTFLDDGDCHRLGRGASFPVLCSSNRTETATPFARSFHLSVSQIPNLPQHRAYSPKPGPPWPWPLGVSQTMSTPFDNGCDRTANSYSLWRNLRGCQSQQCVVAPFHLQITPSPAYHSCTDIIIHHPENRVYSLQDRVHSLDDARADSCNISTQDGARTPPVGENRQLGPGHSSVYPNSCRLRTLLTNARQRLYSSFPDVTQNHLKAHPLPTRYNDRYLEAELYNNDRSLDHQQLLVSSGTGSLGQLPKLQRIALQPLSEELLADVREQPGELRHDIGSENCMDPRDDQIPVAHIPEVDGGNVMSTSREPLVGVDVENDAIQVHTGDAFCNASRKHLPEHSGHCQILTVDCSSDAMSSRSKTPTPNNVSNSKDAIADSAAGSVG